MRLVGLTNATHLNGREGQVTGFIEESGIALVELDAGGGVKCPPMKLLAKFVEHHLDTENTYPATEFMTPLPACVSVPRDTPEELEVREQERQHRAEIGAQALEEAIRTLKTASSCLLGKAFVSSWALEDCDDGNATLASTGEEGERRWRDVVRKRRTWCKPETEFTVDSFELDGQKLQNVDAVVSVLSTHEQVLQRLLDGSKDPVRTSEDVEVVDMALKLAGNVLLQLASAFQRQGRVEEAMEVASGVLALHRRIKVCILNI